MHTNGMDLDRFPEGVLEAVLLKLPYCTVLHAKRVCKTWKGIIESEHYKQSYRGSVKLVETFDFVRLRGFEIVDSNNDVLRHQGGIYFEGITSPKTSLVSGRLDGAEGKIHICNVFRNRVELVPEPRADHDPECISVFSFEGVGRKAVYWDRVGTIMTLALGHPQPEWCTVRSERDIIDAYNTYPVVINNSMFCVHPHKELLAEYNALGNGHFTSLPLTFTGEGTVDFRGRDTLLVAWEGKLYFLTMDEDRDDHRRQTIEIWWISTVDGRATLMNKFEPEHRLSFMDNVRGEDETHILICNWKAGNTREAVSILYNMVTNSVTSTSLQPVLRKPAKLPVFLTEVPK